MEITGHLIEEIIDPTGILEGQRYEFLLDIEVPEDDELYSEDGLSLRVLFYKDEKGSKILNYHFFFSDEKALDFALDEEEEKMVESYCRMNLPA
ncbi:MULTISPECIES: DUF6509 family protein [Bacillaceae]|uniref:Pullulanase n=2 Tax=Bacillus infantis TaxID=324767 RepID=U5LEC1_9BACI|nr:MULTISPECIES: DUF6509 family protein [Bacillus]OXT14769.1 pullulanase [Bacillus sp. OG2]AGX05061.1 hypothetical protein N288_15850 [Bacillus infantis NRRL B-14911]EAR66505.1 hypothetical protein B14911_23157 [Bacillus sp. NRRL B-14911]MCK6204855.1 pullulanase [Bacillus infantis]MCP1159138.1 DUF6509 family protein [Bacillus infantis]